jgi:multidrug resistance efflux pump
MTRAQSTIMPSGAQELESASALQTSAADSSVQERTGLVLRHAAPSQRRLQRVTAPLDVVIACRGYHSANWSLGGVCISGCDLPYEPGEDVPVTLVLNFQGFSIGLDVASTVVRTVPLDRSIVLAFKNLGSRERDLLEHFAHGLLSGEMSHVGSIIQRIDTPATPVTIQLPQTGTAAPHDLTSRRKWTSFAYIGVGASLLGYIGLMLYSQVWRLNVESAVVALPQEVVEAQEQGIIRSVHTAAGANVRAGTLLMRLEESGLQRELADAKIKVKRAELELKSAQRGYSAEAANTPFYGNVSHAKLVQAEQRILAAQASVNEAGAELERARQLKNSGFLSDSALDRAERKASQEEAALHQAQAEFSIAKNALDAAKTGVLYDGNRLVAEIGARKRDLDSARDNLQVASKELDAVLERMARQDIRAPFDAVVKRIGRTSGATFNRGDELLVLEHTASAPHIVAYLTQDEISDIRLGSTAIAYVPALNQSLEVQVIRVDRQFDFLPEGQGLPRWNDLEHRDAVVRLAILSKNAVPNLTAGIPVHINLPREGLSLLQRTMSSLGF